ALHGVARSGLATSFPQAIAMSSTWDPDLVYEIASAISDEARVYNNLYGKGLTYWSPTINLARDPRWGRTEETYGEDPYLTSRLAVSFVRGMQGSDPKYLKTVATVKHFAANNSEFNRHNGSSDMDERTLREYYLPAFRAAVEEAGVYSVMSAYNAINGVPCSANKMLLTDILRNEWGFKGYVVSDCDAIYDIWANHHYVSTPAEAAAVAIKAGTDLNCGGTCQKCVGKAIADGLMTEADVDVALVRLFTARIRLGEFDPPEMVPYKAIPDSELCCQEHQELALRAAREAIVLLKNEKGLLPLDKNKIKSIAVIGPNADVCQLGGYSGTPPFTVTPLKGIADKLSTGVVYYAQGCTIGESGGYLYNINWVKLTSPSGSDLLIEAEDFDRGFGVQTEPCREGGRNVGYINHGDYTAYRGVDFTGKTGFEVRVASATQGGILEVRLDSLDGPVVCTIDVPGTGNWQDWITRSCNISGVDGVHDMYLRFVEREALPDPDQFEKAVEIARKSDVAVVVVGTDLRVADEGKDRTTLDLPGVQEELIKAVYEANPNTVVVLVTGFPLAINWTSEHVPAIIVAWYGGQSQGTAIADVLFGDYNPGGKLTTTWYKSVNDLPPLDDYRIRNGRTYQYFTGTPLYPFGHGLSYTTFSYSNLRMSNVTITPGSEVKISVDIENTGSREGDEVVQLYVHDVDASVQRPIKELKGFQRVHLKPGEKKTVTFTLRHDSLAFWDETSKRFVVENGMFDILVGSSSADIRLVGQIEAAG
ncbi:MAG: glycoside hydrolase family 3 C-terminal domain-containing protein, partial [Nitrososphaerota archaeon]